MIYGYARVSSKDQNLDRQLAELTPVCDVVKLEKVSGKDLNRPELQKLIEFLQPGDQLICKSIDRLARNTKDLLEVVDSLIAKGVTVKFLDNSMSFDNTPASRLILTMMGAVAEFERGIIASRRDEGIAIAKEQGRYKGKQPNKELHSKVTKYLEMNKYSPDEIAKLCDCGRATVFRIKKTLQ
ncbi:recombinase family protein [Mangrovibacter yixingensis]|uniref:recombinase family protein n=1 Tax=Mangrovibacter yixingensis TaxID=1529639 RepID=UPI001CFA0AE4|nr:recombinase family protein [Mangrovibacter yixingensis]